MPRGKSSDGMTKSAFVRGLPVSLSAKQVVEEAKKAGMELDGRYVYVVRSQARRKRGRPAGRRGRPGRRPAANSAEAQFRKLAINIGLDRAEQLLAETKQKIAQIIAGS